MCRTDGNAQLATIPQRQAVIGHVAGETGRHQRQGDDPSSSASLVSVSATSDAVAIWLTETVFAPGDGFTPAGEAVHQLRRMRPRFRRSPAPRRRMSTFAVMPAQLTPGDADGSHPRTDQAAEQGVTPEPDGMPNNPRQRFHRMPPIRPVKMIVRPIVGLIEEAKRTDLVSWIFRTSRT